MSYGEAIRVTRAQRGLTLAELSERIGSALSLGQLSKAERGQRRLTAGELYAIADALVVPTDALRDVRAAHSHFMGEHVDHFMGANR